MNSHRNVVLVAAIVTGLMIMPSESLNAGTDVATEQQRSSSQFATIDTTTVSATASSRAQVWNLTPEDWQRYQSLMQGIRGSISPSSLSPIEVLGIHARTVEERRRYAEQWALMMREDAERILAFQHAYNEAQQRLFPEDQIIDPVKLAVHRSKQKSTTEDGLDATDRVLFFTATDCVPCNAVLDRLLGKLRETKGIDIYLLDIVSGDEDRIREWAGHRHIDPDWVHERRVTLNVDAGALDKLATRLGDPLDQRPVVLRRRGDAVKPLSGAHF